MRGLETLLHDPSSLERGEMLMDQLQEAHNAYRRGVDEIVENDRYLEAEVPKLVQALRGSGAPDDEMFGRLGRAVYAVHVNHEEIHAKEPAEFRALWRSTYGPVEESISREHSSMPSMIAVERIVGRTAIRCEKEKLVGQYPRQAGGILLQGPEGNSDVRLPDLQIGDPKTSEITHRVRPIDNYTNKPAVRIAMVRLDTFNLSFL